jgi:hypothetical protein
MPEREHNKNINDANFHNPQAGLDSSSSLLKMRE